MLRPDAPDHLFRGENRNSLKPTPDHQITKLFCRGLLYIPIIRIPYFMGGISLSPMVSGGSSPTRRYKYLEGHLLEMLPIPGWQQEVKVRFREHLNPNYHDLGCDWQSKNWMGIYTEYIYIYVHKVYMYMCVCVYRYTKYIVTVNVHIYTAVFI